jgi:hypothetical protein
MSHPVKRVITSRHGRPDEPALVIYIKLNGVEYIIPRGFPACRVGRTVYVQMAPWTEGLTTTRLLLYASPSPSQEHFLGFADGVNDRFERALYSATPEWKPQHQRPPAAEGSRRGHTAHDTRGTGETMEPQPWTLSQTEFITYCLAHPAFGARYERQYGSYNVINWSLYIQDAQTAGCAVPPAVCREAGLPAAARQGEDHVARP